MRIGIRKARPASRRVPLCPDLRAAEGGAIHPDLEGLPPHRAGSLPPMPIRELPAPPASLGEWMAAGGKRRSVL